MKESIDQFLERVDEVLERAFPGLDDETSADADEVQRPVLSTISDRRQRQLERLGDPDNEAW